MKKTLFASLLIAFCATAMHAQRDTLRILAIGNSFSVDALEQHLYPIAAADGTTLIIGNLYIGGCSIDLHMRNIQGDRPAYSYRKISADGTRVVRDSTRVSYAIADEPWDFVSVQQVSGFSGIPSSYGNLESLVQYVCEQVPTCQIVFHQTWAYAPDSRHPDYPRYNSDNRQMYKQILSTTHRMSDSVGIALVIPCLRSIQEARAHFPETLITRDGYHLNYTLGRYIASATWYAALTCRPILGNPYRPAGLTPAQLRQAQQCAESALFHD